MNRTTLIRMLQLVGAACAALALQGCPPCGVATDAIDGTWTFERCTDDTCGFTVESGDVRVAPLFHPGEHGLSLAAGASARASVNDTANGFAGSAGVAMLARCDQGATLTVEVEGRSDEAASFAPRYDGGASSTVPAMLTVTPRATTSWSRVSDAFLSNRPLTVLETLRLRVTGSGRCQVDNVRVSRYVYGGYCE